MHRLKQYLVPVTSMVFTHLIIIPTSRITFLAHLRATAYIEGKFAILFQCSAHGIYLVIKKLSCEIGNNFASFGRGDITYFNLTLPCHSKCTDIHTWNTRDVEKRKFGGPIPRTKPR